jgi:hypothetical protein
VAEEQRSTEGRQEEKKMRPWRHAKLAQGLTGAHGRQEERVLDEEEDG